MLNKLIVYNLESPFLLMLNKLIVYNYCKTKFRSMVYNMTVHVTIETNEKELK